MINQPHLFPSSSLILINIFLICAYCLSMNSAVSGIVNSGTLSMLFYPSQSRFSGENKDRREVCRAKGRVGNGLSLVVERESEV